VSEPARRPPPSRPRTDHRRDDRRRRRSGVRRTTALLMVLVALVLGVLVGYIAHGDDDPAGLVTQTRELPVVTVTVPEGG
jgi:ferric-dicitrate binding protein FerR (iron transport regulator)